jgi:hypothetical protein
MSRRLLSRVARLERAAAPKGGVPFQFWQVVTGEVTPEGANSATLRFLQQVLPLEDESSDPIEAELAQFGQEVGINSAGNR